MAIDDSARAPVAQEAVACVLRNCEAPPDEECAHSTLVGAEVEMTTNVKLNGAELSTLRKGAESAS
jgi:hypothetical protein